METLDFFHRWELILVLSVMNLSDTHQLGFRITYQCQQHFDQWFRWNLTMVDIKLMVITESAQDFHWVCMDQAVLHHAGRSVSWQEDERIIMGTTVVCEQHCARGLGSRSLLEASAIPPKLYNSFLTLISDRVTWCIIRNFTCLNYIKCCICIRDLFIDNH